MAQFKPFSKNGQYVHKFDYRGSIGGILSLDAKSGGRWLASGGMYGLEIWDTEDGSQVKWPEKVWQSTRGAVTSVLWVDAQDAKDHALFVGTAKGRLALYASEQYAGKTRFCELFIANLLLAEPSEILDMSFDRESNRLALCVRSGLVVLLRYNHEFHQIDVLHYISFREQGQTVVPKCVAFGAYASNSNERDMTVFSLYGGDIGNAIVVGSHIVIDEPTVGAVLYDGRRKCVAAFKVAATKKMRPRGLAASENGRFIVSASDGGIAFVFDRESTGTQPFDELHVDEGDWVQTIATSTVGGVPTIFVAKSRADLDGDSLISVWQRRPHIVTEAQMEHVLGSLRIVWEYMKIAAIILLVFGAGQYVSELYFPRAG
uniref:WD40 repeat-like protein n=1 Tax=Mycena chlorophos TaxID=658473 RepID=A0ABQ0KWY7_MYCCL|nr:predicted protein [Mycena chlorophos]